MDGAVVTVKEPWVKAKKFFVERKGYRWCHHPYHPKILIVHLLTYFGVIDVIKDEKMC